jgi:ABC-2 type transport system permease protein
MNFMRMLAVLRRFLLLAKRDVHRVFDLIYWPTQDILLWGYTGYWVQRNNTHSEVGLIFLSGLLLWTFMVQVDKEIPWSLAEEFWSDNFTNLIATPMKISEWMLALMILGILKGICVLLYTIIVTWFVFGINILAIGWFLVPIIIIFTIFGWALGFFTATFLVYYGQKIQVLTWIIGWLFAPFCGVFYPITILPTWMQKVGWALPPTYLFHFIQQKMTHNFVEPELLAIAFGLSLFYFICTTLLYKLSFEASKKYGLARLERYE